MQLDFGHKWLKGKSESERNNTISISTCQTGRSCNKSKPPSSKTLLHYWGIYVRGSGRLPGVFLFVLSKLGLVSEAYVLCFAFYELIDVVLLTKIGGGQDCEKPRCCAKARSCNRQLTQNAKVRNCLKLKDFNTNKLVFDIWKTLFL